MKIFAIRDETDNKNKDLAYLLYFEKDKRFYIELPDGADYWETPLLLTTFANKGEHTINSYWSKLWVQQRIIPPDRQNIGQVLRDNRINTYDEYELLMLSSGKCAQDDYYLVLIDEKELPLKIINRFNKRIEDIIPLSDYNVMIFFCDGVIKKCDLAEHFKNNQEFSILFKRQVFFENIKIQSGGYGIFWDDNLSISYGELRKIGKNIPLQSGDFIAFVRNRVINTLEATEILNCSRQYINELVKTNKLHPIKSSEKNTLFLKSEILQRNWQ